MTHVVKTHEKARDDDIGVMKKEVTGDNGLHFDTPTVSFRPKDGSAPSLFVNEVIKHIDENTITSLENNGTSQYVQAVKNEHQSKALNVVIFNLKVNNFPTEKNLDTLAQTLYSASDKLIFLPTVKTSLLSAGKKIEMTRVDKFIEMMDTIIKKTNDVGNSKEFVGTVPLIPATPVRKIIEFYRKHDIQTFAIDGCTKDILLNDADLRVVLSAIDGENHCLSDTLIYACNLGYPRIVKDESRADDFLSVFAHVDIFGSMFKGRGGKSKKPSPATKKSKLFSNDSYSYKSTTIAEAREKFGSPMSPDVLKSINRKRQLIETGHIRDMVGKEGIKPFLLKKSSVGQPIVNRLEALAKL